MNPPSSNFSAAMRAVPAVLGIVGLVAMLLLAAFAGKFLAWHFGLGGLSLASIAIGLAWQRNPRWRQSMASLVYSIFFVLSVVLVYMISANRYQRLDITRDRVHTLDRQTLNVLRNLPPGDRFRIQVFAPLAEHAGLARFLDSYRHESAQIEYDTFDPARDIDQVAAAGTRVEKGFLAILRVDAEGNTIRKETGTLDYAGMNRESQLTNALARTIQSDQQVIYFVTGHGERPLDNTENSLTKVAQLVASSTVPILPRRLGEGTIPANASAIVIAGPTRDLFDWERDLLEGYLNEGGKLFILLDPVLRRDSQFGNMEGLLASMGLELPNRLIVDPTVVSSSNSSFTPLVTYTTHPIGESAAKSMFLLNEARPIKSLPNDVAPEFLLEAILITGQNTWSESFEELRSVRSPVPPSDPKAIEPLIAAVSAKRSTKGGRFGNEARAVVIGDSDAFLDVHFGQNPGGAAFFASSLAWLRESQTVVYIPPKTLSTTPVLLTNRQFYMLFGGFAALGLLITLGGTALTLRRRWRR